MTINKRKNNLLKDKKLNFLSLGDITPQGWLKKQLEIQAEGLTGNIDEFWEDLGPNNKWLGGDGESWERAPYYADGLVPLAYILNDKKLEEKAKTWVEAFLDYQDEKGWIGPKNQGIEELSKEKLEYDPWPTFIVFKVLIQYYEVSQDKKVIEVMTKCCKYLNQHLDKEPLSLWAKFRWSDLVLSIHWLYEQTSQKWLLDFADKVFSQGYDWKKHFSDFKYKEKNTEIKMETHVVNNAMGIKAPGIWFRQSKENSDKDAVYDAIKNLDKFHGQVTGVFTGDEHLSGKNPSQGTELCSVVEYMFSLENLISIFGDTTLIDRLEKITFNALPATFKPDMWAHQYDQQANQVICNIAKRKWTNGPDANIFGLEPHFGCCTANMHQGWPKFIKSLWMKTEDNTLVAGAYSPCKVTTTIDDSEVVIIEETEYPFKEEIKFKIKGENSISFPLLLRIPSWAENAKIKLPGNKVESPEAGTLHRIEQKWNPGDIIKLLLPMEIKSERRYRGAVSIKRGPLVYSLRIGEEWKMIDGKRPHADWEVYPTTLWNYGLNLNLDDLDESVEVSLKNINETPFSPNKPPVELKVKGSYIKDWNLKDNWAQAIPLSPIRSAEKLEELTLIPYGCSNLRITEFPLLNE